MHTALRLLSSALAITLATSAIAANQTVMHFSVDAHQPTTTLKEQSADVLEVGSYSCSSNLVPGARMTIQTSNGSYLTSLQGEITGQFRLTSPQQLTATLSFSGTAASEKCAINQRPDEEPVPCFSVICKIISH